MDWLDPKQVKEKLKLPKGLNESAFEGYYKSHLAVEHKFDLLMEAMEQFVRAHSEGEIACEQSPNGSDWTSPRPGCKCDCCNSVNVARIIVEALDE